MASGETRRGQQARVPPYRPLVLAAIPFSVGILTREWVAVAPTVGWSAVAAAAVAYPLARLARRRRVALGALYILLAGAGWARLSLAAREPPPHGLARFVTAEPKLVKLRGVVDSDPLVYVSPPVPLAGDSYWLRQKVRKARFELDAEEVMVEGAWRATCGRVRVTLYEPFPELSYGDQIAVAGTAWAPRQPSSPGQFDAARLWRRKGIRAVMAAGVRTVRVERRGRGLWPKALACAARRRLRRLLHDTLARRDKATAAMLCATILGDRTELDDDLEEVFKRSGTMHLLAVSGLHVGIVAALVWTLCSLLSLGRRVSGMLVLAAAAFYASMVGLTPAAVRAAVMTAALVLAIVGRRRLDALQAVALAALILLVWRPYDLFHAGFQLSFVAVVSIICLHEEMVGLFRRPEKLAERLTEDERLSLPRRFARWLRRLAVGALGVSAAAWLGVAPLIAYYFNLFSPITVATNLLAVPLLGLVVTLGFVHLGLALLWQPLAMVPGLLAQGATAALAGVVGAFAMVPLGWTYCATPAVGWLVGYYALGVVVVARRRLGLSGKHAAMLWLAGVLVYVVATFRAPRPDGFEACVLDVRHGNAAVLRYPDGSTVVCDSGSYGRGDVGRTVVAPALWHSGVRRVDLLVVSHADVDHINGIPALLERFRIGRVIYSPVVPRNEAGQQLLAMLDEREIPHEEAVAGTRLEVGEGNHLEVLAPLHWMLAARPKNQNENSLVLRAEHDGRRILFCGDLQELGTAVLMEARVDLRADVLVVPHHGCRMRNADAFAAVVRPTYALCSNRADHLHPQTVAAYQRAGATVLATCWRGAIAVRIRDGALEVVPFRPRRAGAPVPGER